MSEKTTPWTAADIPDLKGRTAVVTGATAGLGLETARMLAERGARVLLACRNVEKAAGVVELIHQTAPEAQLPIVELDLSSQESVRDAAARIRDEYDSIDLLVNNAGTMSHQRTETADGFESTLATNYLGPFAFTGLLLDLLLAAPAGRIVTVSSGTSANKSSALDVDDLFYQRRKYQQFAVYGQSKLANLLFTFELQRQLNGMDTNLVALAAHPGAARTDFNKLLPPMLMPLTSPKVDWIFKPLLQTAEMGALPTLRAAVDPTARGGEFFGPSGRLKGYPVLNEACAAAHDPELAARLWLESERLTGVVYSFDASVQG
ncbi:oxidoreductase [Nocardia sp. NPDC051030]|uniref:oxidoreductase n=1 Tax=Nocardia sp. NPDC051030 TaxID=3155162 RepID=UPI0034230AA7